MTLEEAYEYVHFADEAEGEQRGEYGMGAASLGYDPGEWMSAYDGYRCSEDPEYAKAQRIIAAATDRETWQQVGKRIDAAISDNTDDIPF
jgi:hypothetical protein